MYKLFKHMPKNDENIRGVKDLEEGENPFENPSLLCLCAQDIDKNVFGITKLFMHVAGLRVRNNPGAKFDLSEFPVTFLSFQKQRDTQTEEESADKFVNEYFMPLLEESTSKEETMKKFRNINIMTYCDGTQRIINIITNLREKMQKKGYSEEDLKDVLSQISLVSILTNRDFRGLGITCADFHDFNDTEVEIEDRDWIFKMEEISRLGEKEDFEALLLDEENRIVEYAINGSGEHFSREFIEEGKAMPACLTTIVHNMLENSIQNSKNSEFKPLTIQELVNGCKEIFDKVNKGKNIEEITEEIYENLQYTGGNKLTSRECKILDEVDKMSDSMIDMTRKMEKTECEKDKFESQNRIMMDAIEKNSTEITRDKALLELGWNFNQEEKTKIEESDTDKEKIEKQEKQIKKLQNMLKKTLSFADRVRTSRFGRFFFRSALKELPQGEEEER